jgi:hypothetical protein
VAAGPLPGDERRHPDAPVEEWVFTCWSPDATVGIVSGYRIVGPSRGWYWAALARAGKPLLHVAEWDVPLRSDPLLVKAAGLWAEHICDDPLRQWTVGNETYAAALDDPDEGLGRAYGAPTAIAFDLEWYATAAPEPVASGYEQAGEVHGVVEFAAEPALHLDGVPAWRAHRWGLGLAPVRLPAALAHVGLRAGFAFPDGTVADWVLTAEGWRSH